MLDRDGDGTYAVMGWGPTKGEIISFCWWDSSHEASLLCFSLSRDVMLVLAGVYFHGRGEMVGMLVSLIIASMYIRIKVTDEQATLTFNLWISRVIG